MGKLFIIFGILLVVVGLLLQSGTKIPFLGKLPGDIYIERPNFKFYFPLMTSIVLSIIFTLILFLINKFRH